MPFAALGDDILLNILSLCDVYRVLTVSAVINKHLRGLTQVKQLWLSLLQDSTFREVLELRPPGHGELESLSTAELVELVKRAAIGPPSCWPTGPLSTQSTSYNITFDTDLGSRVNRGFHLLSGARYMLLTSKQRKALSQRVLSMYEVWNGRCVWTLATSVYTRWAIDLVPGGAIARMLIAELEGVDQIGHRFHLRVEDVDLTMGVFHEVFSLGNVRLNSVSAIVGDFFLYPLLPSYGEVNMVLVNWRTLTYVVLNYGTESNSAAILIPGNIVATHPDSAPPHQQLLTVTELDAFSPYWKPLPEINLLDKLSPGTIPISAQARLEYNTRPLGDRYTPVALSTTPSALYQGAHTIVVYAGELPDPPQVEPESHRPGEASHTAVVSYLFRPPPSPEQACGLRLVSSQCATHDLDTARLIPPRAVVTQSGSSCTVSYYQ
ncbi:hypothetical protein B0H11DRAFT_2061098 [Mycena galericulata]|nr:hypothetical protein B0H11DRAFT_2061098 [Mycena galericulata]